MCYYLVIETCDDIINFKIDHGSSSKAITDREKKKGGRKYKILNISRRKELFR